MLCDRQARAQDPAAVSKSGSVVFVRPKRVGSGGWADLGSGFLWVRRWVGSCDGGCAGLCCFVWDLRFCEGIWAGGAVRSREVGKGGDHAMPGPDCGPECAEGFKPFTITGPGRKHGAIVHGSPEERTKSRHEQNGEGLTSRDLPNTTFGDNKACPGHFHCDLTVVHEEDHLHLPRVLGPFEAARGELDHPRAEEG